jgi:hypothetical protein
MRARKFILMIVCSTALFTKSHIAAVRGVYARRKGPVKRKGVISRGCEANCVLPFWAKQAQMNSNSIKYNYLRGPTGPMTPHDRKV